MKKFFAMMVVLIGICLTCGNCYAISDEEVFNITMKKAQNGDVRAQYLVGYMYEIGKRVKQNYKKAFEWYEKAAVQGDSYAQFNLGIMYNNGQGVRQDKSIAKKWYGKSCDNGNQKGCDAYRELNEAGY